MYSPTKLVLIDPFDGPMCSGDADGNNVEWFDGASNHRLVLDKFGHLPNVKVIKARSCEVEFPRGEPSYDLVYVDGDHSAAGVAFDLEWALRRMKSGGYICGHDYSVNPAKTHNRYNFGVKEAVDKFCAQHGFRISGIMMDGCVGYVIQVS
jgi:predicted O-methyltransferase YrrM